MYFWRIDRLTQDLKTRPMTDQEVLPYFLVAIALMALCLDYFPHPHSVWRTVWHVILALGGTYYLYLQNGRSQGKQFLQRYMSISLVVSIRWLVAYFAIAICFQVIAVYLFKLNDTLTNSLQMDLSFIGEVFMYWWIGYHIRDVATATRHPDDALPDKHLHINADVGILD